MEKEKLTTIIIISVCLLAIAIFGFIKPFTIVGTMSFPYTHNSENTKAMFFGSDYFLPSPLKFNCTNDYSAPKTVSVGRSPNKCWSTDIIWKQGSNIEHFTMFAGETKQLNKYLEVTFKPSGSVRYGCYKDGEICFTGQFKRETDWSNRFTFEIINTDFLTSKTVDDDYEILLNSDKKMKVEITNDFAPNIRGGLWIKTTNLMLFREKTSNSYFYLMKGTNTYEKTPIPTDFLGVIRVERKPFVIVNNNVEDIKLMDNTPTYTEYKVVRNPTVNCDNTAEVCCENGVLMRECDRIRLGLSLGTNCGAGIDTDTGDYPDNTTVETGWKDIRNYTWLIVLVIIVIGVVIWWKKKN